jgi:hypothetical protein
MMTRYGDKLIAQSVITGLLERIDPAARFNPPPEGDK